MQLKFPVGMLVASLAVSAWVGPGAAVWAADERPARESAADPSERLRAALDDMKLTGETKKKVDEVLAKAKADVAKARADAGDDRRAAIGKIGEITRAAAVEIAGALDEDQKMLLANKLKAGAAASSAGEGPARGGVGPASIGDRIKGAVAPLGLSEEQNKKMDAVIADLQKKADDIRAGGGADMRGKFDALREDGQKQIKAILSEEQFAKFTVAMQQQGGGGMRLGGGLARFQEAVKGLDLTADQKTKLDAAFAEAKKQFEELAPQVQGGQPTPELREKLGGVFRSLQAQLGTILTEEQQEKLKASMPQRGAGGERPARPPEKKKE